MRLGGRPLKHEFKEIEPKWQKKWEQARAFHAENDYTKPKYYALVEFPYPSGQGLHVGHPRSYTALDIVARKRRMQGYNVLYPMGWDAFGLPTENFAIKNHIHPEIVTAQNVAHFKAQLQSLGLSFDWEREINTTDPAYYRWTQWILMDYRDVIVHIFYAETRDFYSIDRVWADAPRLPLDFTGEN